jgi:hypothetical protein
VKGLTTGEQFLARGRVLVGTWTGTLTNQVPDARVVDVPGGGHYLWITREDLVDSLKDGRRRRGTRRERGEPVYRLRATR